MVDQADNTYAPKSDVSPAWEWNHVTPNDDYSDVWSVPPRFISISASGSINFLKQNGVSGMISGGLDSGNMYPLRPAKVLSTGTTATGIVAYW